MKELYIFATSDNPNPYINAIAYSIEHLNVGSIYVIVISEHDYPAEEQKAQLMATDVTTNINLQLKVLQEGRYMIFGRQPEDNRVVELENKQGFEIYSNCLRVINKSGSTGIAISHSTLEVTLRNYIKSGNCLFDVSALKKNLLVDVVSILLSYGFSGVYSFELKRKPYHNQQDLYHNLKTNEYVFRNLAVSTPVKNSLRRISRWNLRAKAIILFTILIALIFIPISIFWQDSPIITIFNAAAVIAGISSYLFLFVQEKVT